MTTNYNPDKQTVTGYPLCAAGDCRNYVPRFGDLCAECAAHTPELDAEQGADADTGHETCNERLAQAGERIATLERTVETLRHSNKLQGAEIRRLRGQAAAARAIAQVRIA